MATADASTTSVKRTAIPPKKLALWVVLALGLIIVPSTLPTAAAPGFPVRNLVCGGI